MCAVSSLYTLVIFVFLNFLKVDMVIEEVVEINTVLLLAQSTDLLWRICQVGAAGKT